MLPNGPPPAVVAGDAVGALPKMLLFGAGADDGMLENRLDVCVFAGVPKSEDMVAVLQLQRLDNEVLLDSFSTFLDAFDGRAECQEIAPFRFTVLSRSLPQAANVQHIQELQCGLYATRK